MSFGIGLGDILALLSKAKSIYQNAKSAPREFRSALQDVESFAATLEETYDALKSWPLNAKQQQRCNTILKGCTSVLEEYEDMISDYRSLGTDKRKLRDRFSWTQSDVDALKRRLELHSNMLISFKVSVIGATVQKVYADGQATQSLIRQLHSQGKTTQAMIKDINTDGRGSSPNYTTSASASSNQYIARSQERLGEESQSWFTQALNNDKPLPSLARDMQRSYQRLMPSPYRFKFTTTGGNRGLLVPLPGTSDTAVRVGEAVEGFQGSVSRWNCEKGWGFLEADDGGNDVFCTMLPRRIDEYRSLNEGVVEFEIEEAHRFRKLRSGS
ncbi:hypothetical protein P154DRAFT_620810 [Amniculicola lignicola CBS 123094]|uniref:CSD domain-containing protein n=1 Tax=Amniculicola lignicola CBS 123094 TaxID=1392246 RepID=A0A6A5WHN5_9PLEO|nr:hypothetical protein P154DRAFT_620810 [Amniculicola lignicola CBS 123094]